jgi:hypothetical protein
MRHSFPAKLRFIANVTLEPWEYLQAKFRE